MFNLTIRLVTKGGMYLIPSSRNSRQSELLFHVMCIRMLSKLLFSAVSFGMRLCGTLWSAPSQRRPHSHLWLRCRGLCKPYPGQPQRVGQARLVPSVLQPLPEARRGGLRHPGGSRSRNGRMEASALLRPGRRDWYGPSTLHTNSVSHSKIFSS
jgi:hypothetical protein